MTINGNTFSQSPPRRPTLDDFNGAVKANDINYPPDARTQPTAEEFNTLCNMVVAMGAVCPFLVVSIANNGTTASILNFTCAGGNIALGDLTVTRVSLGLVKLTIAIAKFGDVTRQPMACANGTTAAKCAASYVESGANYEFSVKLDIDANLTMSLG